MLREGAEPGDLFIDDTGKLWRVIGYCPEPTVTMEEVEPGPRPNPQYTAYMQQTQNIQATLPPDPRQRISGGVSGLMWSGFKRIFQSQKD